MSDNSYKSMYKKDLTFTPTRNLTRLQDDECEQQRQAAEESTKLKYVTTNHLDLLEGHEYNWFGIGLRDQIFVPQENMDGDSYLRYAPLTNCRVRDSIGQLPIPTLPSLHNAHVQDTDKESNYLWPLHNRGEKTCNPREVDYYNRSFYLFPEMKHEAIKSVQTSTDYRQGISTRFLDLDTTQAEKRAEFEKSIELLRQ